MPPLVRIATRTYPPDVGAAPFRLRALARALVEAGCEVEVVTTSATAPETADPGVATRRRPVLRDADGAVRGYVPYLSFDVPLAARLLTGARPDVVVHEPPPTTGVVTRVTSALRRVPYVSYLPDVWSQGAVAAGAPAPVLRAVALAEQAALRGAARVLAVTAGMAEEVVRGGVDPARVRVVGNGVDVDVFRPAADPAADPATADPGPPAGDLRVVYSGTMSEWQGAEVLLRGFARVLRERPGARLTLVGGGVDVPRLRALAAELAPHAIDLPGTVAPERAARLLAGADLALASLVPGTGYDLMSPTKIYAATACGTPVLFAGVGTGAAVVREHGLGVVVDHDPDAVAAALRAATTPDPATRARLREWALAHGSLAAAARRAADAVLEALRPPR
ncbi:glycosyltransferase [Kineococcus radiotolerans]|uniref:Glycosyl transferase group 1 n=1 Tax=Kineococcus radiotolerans (strain ATCC BAA-149 / DSM 14245 / SRS30216) TaxID=266940 RepID=A6WEW6_KINRD|nr:glycosyltransferase [Kineococcus radiotolerans]ABS05355.1 glycosyl transferase group 1 [Kineococcus radiotolerans SRS30216 = ATCC BAA-149]